MMHNKLLLAIAAYVAFYWGGSPFIPGIYYSFSASVMMLIGAGFMMLQYASSAWGIVVRGHRNPVARPGGDGSHLAALGAFGIAFYLAYSGVFNMAYLAAGEPDNWTVSAVSSFGRHIGWPSLFLFLVAPHVGQTDIPRPRVAWLVLIVLLAIVAAFYLGLQVGQAENQTIPSAAL